MGQANVELGSMKYKGGHFKKAPFGGEHREGAGLETKAKKRRTTSGGRFEMCPPAFYRAFSGFDPEFSIVSYI